MQDEIEALINDIVENDVKKPRLEKQPFCKSCMIKKLCIINNVWFSISRNPKHENIKNLENKINILSVSKNRLYAYNDIFKTSKKVENFFDVQPYQNHFDLGKSFKPMHSVWFSRGSWLTFPNLDIHDHKNHEENEKYIFNDLVVFMIKIEDPKILKITNFKEFHDFTMKYNANHDTDLNFGMFINWNRVRSDGFKGIMIDFCKIYDASDFKDYKYDIIYEWHSTWDVESLCIWDFSCFNNTVFPAKFIYSE